MQVGDLVVFKNNARPWHSECQVREAQGLVAGATGLVTHRAVNQSKVLFSTVPCPVWVSNIEVEVVSASR